MQGLGTVCIKPDRMCLVEVDGAVMNQADLALKLRTKRTRKRELLDEMDRVVP